MREGTPTVDIERYVCVTIKVEGTPEERAKYKVVDDDGTIHHFLAWQRHHDVYPDHAGVVGPGLLVQYFEAEHEDALRAYFAKPLRERAWT